jgi:thiol-disulfide isomerase/thioredoxin
MRFSIRRASFAATMLGLAVVCTIVAAAAAIPQPGAVAPNFSLELIANGKGTVSLDKYKGKGVYLNFFASWCVPCKAEVPSIAQLSKAFAKRGVVVIGVDELESPDAARGFVARFKLPYPIGLDDSGALGAAYGLIGMPLSVFIGRDGKIAMRRSGQLTEAQIRAGMDQIARK